MTDDRIYYSHEAQIHATREVSRLMLMCLALGAGTGIMVALLLASNSGKKIRDELTKTVEEGLNTSQEALSPIVKRVEKELGELRQTVEERVLS